MRSINFFEKSQSIAKIECLFNFNDTNVIKTMVAYNSQDAKVMLM